MERINPVFFYQVGALLKPLTEMQVEHTSRVDIWLRATEVDSIIRVLLDFYSSLTVCRRSGVELINTIADVADWMRKTPPKEWQEEDYSVDVKFRLLIDKAKEFQTVLCEELQMLATYHVTQKGIYSTDGLISETEKILPVPVIKRLDKKIKEEIKESGRCLAFDNATASAFHIMRATEAVLHKYYISVCKPKSKNKLGNWGAYLSALHKLSEDSTVEKALREDVRKVEVLLQQIKDQDRNLIMHPEIILTPDEAFTLFEIAKGAIMAMANRLPPTKTKK
ncbi:hypothetical protein ACFLV4_00150 [Chloroflexota bacterium]